MTHDVMKFAAQSADHEIDATGIFARVERVTAHSLAIAWPRKRLEKVELLLSTRQTGSSFPSSQTSDYWLPLPPLPPSSEPRHFLQMKRKIGKIPTPEIAVEMVRML